MPPVKRPSTAKESKSTEGLRLKLSSNALKDQPTPSVSAITVSGASTHQTKRVDNGPDYEESATPPISRHGSLKRNKAPQEQTTAMNTGSNTPPDSSSPSASRRSSWRRDNTKVKESVPETNEEPRVNEPVCRCYPSS